MSGDAEIEELTQRQHRLVNNCQRDDRDEEDSGKPINYFFMYGCCVYKPNIVEYIGGRNAVIQRLVFRYSPVCIHCQMHVYSYSAK